MPATIWFGIFCLRFCYSGQMENYKKYNSVCCLLWVPNLVCQIKGISQTEDEG